MFPIAFPQETKETVRKHPFEISFPVSIPLELGNGKRKNNIMNEYKYILEPYKSMDTRYHCPSCKHRDKTFSRYINTETGEHIHPSVGRCNREIKCGYHLTPRQFFGDNPENLQYPNKSNTFKNDTKSYNSLQLNSFTTIPDNMFKKSLKAYEDNYFVLFLIAKFGYERTNKLISRYFIATSNHWPGSTVFWQIDVSGKIRTGKIMLYNFKSCKRVKEPFNHINWAHKALKLPQYQLSQCLFGEHLLKDNINPVAIVESEKTAIIASLYMPQFVWLATGCLTNLCLSKCQVLEGRPIILFPDLNAYEKWCQKAKELAVFGSVKVSDLLETHSSSNEKEKGLDIADYLLQFHPSDFTQSPKQAISSLGSSFDNLLDHNKDDFNNKKTKPAYVDSEGKFYIPTPLAKTFTVYPSIKQYNDRYCFPEFINKGKINYEAFDKVEIELGTLTVRSNSFQLIT